MFALVDCNNFYVSCERTFQPHLEGKPVVVLSNNDGCVVSRSAEAKALGIPMGEPYFKAKPVLDQHGGHVLSSNYALYGDISRRVMGHLADVAPGVEIYSIDEAFLDVAGMERWLGGLDAYARRIRAEIRQYTHIPTCIGIAPTKTLAKLANRVAKKRPELEGVLYLDTEERRLWALEQVAVEDVWGIGHQYAQKLHSYGVSTAALLARVKEPWARKHLGGVVGARLVRELQGYPCLTMAPSEDGTLSRQSIACTRTFGKTLTAYQDVLGAVAAFTTRAAEKLRRQGSAVNMLTVFISKNRFGTEPPPYTYSSTLHLPVLTSDTAELIRYARTLLKRLWLPGTHYKKAGVVFDGLEAAGQQQLSLFEATAQTEQRVRLMAELDKLNSRYGSGTVGFAVSLAGSAGKEGEWTGKRQLRTPAYTTRMEELWRIKMDGACL
ncbi:Y-family DNA polymerase [Hymenobacter cellulosivorans]|uniref:Y-family DNA polymerase n=1 Tax=Hymenobacter cellulosivorans TaxID=2932249 RepID=A0ABY4FAH8_9BACT|nr:Y-family DNA polymerase [Hymenobacter cellulosivorans]UOQ53027.1 Y-family DNA polymerase [Hymenobacter cellulosivorans]